MRRRRTLLMGLLLVGLLAAGGAAGRTALQDRGAGPPTPPEASALFEQAASRRTGTDNALETLQSRLSRRQQDPDLLAQLGAAYLQKARETGNPAFYAKAEAALRRSLDLAPENGGALQGMGELALARHQFTEALDWGRRAVQANPHRAANYGIVGDALVELGRYDEAVAAVQTMVDTRPDLSSYARVSYQRELHGDIAGAIEAMRLAVEAGGPFAENTSYVRVQLGNLYFNSGRPDEAQRQYDATLARQAGYGPALAGLARVRAARGDLPGAIDAARRATEATPLPETVILLGDLYRLAGQTEQAAQQYDLVRVLSRLQAAAGTDTDVETALFDADHETDLPAALARAREGYARRQSIHAADALAWALYQSGRPEEAEPYAREALRLGTPDALKLYHAGMVARALGKADVARDYLSRALALNPHFSLIHAPVARETLAALTGPAPTAARSAP